MAIPLNGVVGGPLVLNNVEDLIFSTGGGTDSLTVFGSAVKRLEANQLLLRQ